MSNFNVLGGSKLPGIDPKILFQNRQSDYNRMQEGVDYMNLPAEEINPNQDLQTITVIGKKPRRIGAQILPNIPTNPPTNVAMQSITPNPYNQINRKGVRQLMRMGGYDPYNYGGDVRYAIRHILQNNDPTGEYRQLVNQAGLSDFIDQALNYKSTETYSQPVSQDTPKYNLNFDSFDFNSIIPNLHTNNSNEPLIDSDIVTSKPDRVKPSIKRSSTTSQKPENLSWWEWYKANVAKSRQEIMERNNGKK